METTTITVRYVNQPKTGKKFGNVKTTEDEVIAVFPSDLNLFQPGQSYSISYDTMNFADGRSMKKFVRMADSLSGVASKPAAPTQVYSAAPAQVRAASPAEASKALEMGVMGFLARFYAGGHSAGILPPTANDIAASARAYILGWEAAFGGAPLGQAESAKPASAEFDDKIPF